MNENPSIISVSRRTDIPAWHGPWFRACLDAGYAEYPNPFNRHILRVSLLPDDVIGFVFWSKNFTPFLDTLDTVANRGYTFYCQYTITALPDLLEPNLPPLDQRIDCLKLLSTRYGPERVVWRFDPIVISETISLDATYRRFIRMVDQLSGCTRLCCVSFMQLYQKVVRRMARLEEETDFSAVDPALDDKRALLARMAGYAATAGIRLAVCCQDELLAPGIEKAHCVDRDLLQQLADTTLPAVERKGTRAQCGCSFSRDIGTYTTCQHHCRYCYANR